MQSTSIKWDAGSFRDPVGSVFFHGEEVYRTVNYSDISSVQSLLSSDFFKDYVKSGAIIGTEIKSHLFPELEDVSPFVLKHELIPFISYPHEWSFFMLKEAALLTLSIMENGLKEGFILKDGTAWNITFHRGKMCFFDVLSIGKYEEGQTWEGYRQFCQEFLYPLMLKAYKDIDFNEIFKGTLSGISAHIMNEIFNGRDLFKPGIFKHVYLNAKIGQQKTLEKAQVRKQFNLSKASLLGIVKNLKNIITNLNPKGEQSLWNNYTSQNTYTDKDTELKKRFISESISGLKSVVDIGCNSGEYSFLSSEKAKVYSCDLDSNCIDQIFMRNKKEDKDITPFVLNLMNPSGNSGWWLRERRSIFERLKSDGFLALALIHHICIASNVPIEQFIKFLSQVAPQGVLEWVDKNDPMVKFLLRNRSDIFDKYNWDHFYITLQRYFTVEKIQKINNGTRTLCFLKPLT